MYQSIILIQVKTHKTHKQSIRYLWLPINVLLTWAYFVFFSEINSDFSRKSQNFPPPCILRPPMTEFLWNWLSAHEVKQVAQLMLTNPRDAFRGQSRSPNIVTFHMLGSCTIVTLSLRRAGFPVFDFKNVVTLKSGAEVTQDHWKWYHYVDWVWFPISVL